MTADNAPRAGAVVIAGASGFVGRALVERFRRDGWDVRTIGRGGSADATWGGDLTSVLDGADAVVNLAGRSVSCRYNRRNADEILTSRLVTTRELGRAMAACANPPEVWINSSTGTIYRDARDHAQAERDGELGEGFSVTVARAWERELFDAPVEVRRVALRLSIVLGNGGALNPIVNMARLGVGGRQGDGGQRVSWVHVDDVYRAIRFVMERRELDGPINVAAPQVVTNSQLMRAVRERFGGLGPRVGVAMPARLLRFGAVVIRTEEEMVLKSRWVDAERLRDAGFVFEHPTLGEALDEIAAHTPRGLLPVPLG